MNFILTDAQAASRCLAYLSQLPLLPVQEVVVRKYVRSRSDAQNRLLWMWYAPIADHVGMTSEELHELMKSRVLGYEEVEVPEGLRGFMGPTRKIGIPKSTKKLPVEEMTKFLEAVAMLAGELSVRLVYPDDYRYALYGERVG